MNKLNKDMVKVHNESMRCVSYLITQKGYEQDQATQIVLECLQEIFDSPYKPSTNMVIKLLRLAIIDDEPILDKNTFKLS